MSEKVLSRLVSAAMAVPAILVLVGWLALSSGTPGAVRIATPEPAVVEGAEVDIRGSFRAFDATAQVTPGLWPRFRGSAFDNVARDGPPLARTWPPDGPPKLWAVDLGEGHAGPAVRGGRVYLLDYLENEKADALRCFSLADGRELWRRWYGVRVKRNHGMSRTVPAVSDEVVLTVGPRCHVMCVDPRTGAFLWGVDMVREFGAQVPMWYTGQCPLVDGDTAILAPGGSALLVGLDARTGLERWRTDNPRGFQMSHSSIIPMTLAGKRTYVYCAVGGVVGVSAEEADAGRLLWETDAWNHKVVAPSPVALLGDRILVTAGYGAGSMVLAVTEVQGRFKVAPVMRWTRRHFSCEQHTPVFHGGRLFSVMPADGGALRKELVCMDPQGLHIWTSGPRRRFGLGPFLCVGQRMLLLRDDGFLTLLRTNGAGYVEEASARVLFGRDAWAPMALVDGRLLLRDAKKMICLDLRANAPGED
jgi:outer membrane protein assembly factor BamB